MRRVDTVVLERWELRWVGPAAWSDWVAVLTALGGRVDDAGPLEDPFDPGEPVFDEGWLGGLPADVALAAGRALVERTGRPVTWFEASAEAVREGRGIEIVTERARRRIGAGLRWTDLSPTAERREWFDPDELSGDAIGTETASGLARDAVVPTDERVPPRVAAHPELASRRVSLRGATRGRSTDSGVVRFRAAAGTVERSGGQVDQLLLELERLGQLDPSGAAPDLARWSERALRRCGLAAVPSPGDPERARFDETWRSLTAADRGRAGRAGAVARWRLTAPGRWLVPPDERRLLAARIPGLPEGPELEVEVEPPAVPAVPDPRPWPEVVATIDAGVLSAIADGVEVLRARQGPDDRLELVRGAATEDQLARLWSAARRSG